MGGSMKSWKKSELMMMCNNCGKGPTGAVYGLGFLGALIYFLQHANSLGAGLLGVLQSLVWPAVLVYRVFGLLKM